MVRIFELITQIRNRELYNNKLSKMNNKYFVPNVSLAIGCDNISSLSMDQINKIISLISVKDSLILIIHILMKEINNISNKEEQYKNISLHLDF